MPLLSRLRRTLRPGRQRARVALMACLGLSEIMIDILLLAAVGGNLLSVWANVRQMRRYYRLRMDLLTPREEARELHRQATKLWSDRPWP